MSAIGAKKSAAIGAKFFDDFLRSHGALCDDLLGYSLRRGLPICSSYLHGVGLNQLNSGIRLQVLDDALRHEHQGAHYANRQQNPKQATRGINPEVAEFVR